MINGFYKSHCASKSGSTVVEFGIDLDSSMTIRNVFIINRYRDRTNSYRFGTCEIRLGDDSADYSSSNNVVYPDLYDGGFFAINSN